MTENWETEEHIKKDLENIAKMLNIPYEDLRKGYDRILVIKEKDSGINEMGL